MRTSLSIQHWLSSLGARPRGVCEGGMAPAPKRSVMSRDRETGRGAAKCHVLSREVTSIGQREMLVPRRWPRGFLEAVAFGMGPEEKWDLPGQRRLQAKGAAQAQRKKEQGRGGVPGCWGLRSCQRRVSTPLGVVRAQEGNRETAALRKHTTAKRRVPSLPGSLGQGWSPMTRTREGTGKEQVANQPCGSSLAGILTGRCVNYSSELRTCEIQGWCPTEVDTVEM